MLFWNGRPLTKRSAYAKAEPHPLQKHLELLADACAIPSIRNEVETTPRPAALWHWDLLEEIMRLPEARAGCYPAEEWC